MVPNYKAKDCGQERFSPFWELSAGSVGEDVVPIGEWIHSIHMANRRIHSIVASWLILVTHGISSKSASKLIIWLNLVPLQIRTLEQVLELKGLKDSDLKSDDLFLVTRDIDKELDNIRFVPLWEWLLSRDLF